MQQVLKILRFCRDVNQGFQISDIDISEHWTPAWRTCHVKKLCWKVEGKGQSCKTSRYQDIKTLTYFISISENLSENNKDMNKNRTTHTLCQELSRRTLVSSPLLPKVGSLSQADPRSWASWWWWLMASLFSIAGNNHKNVAVKTYFISLTLRTSHWTAQQNNIQEN